MFETFLAENPGSQLFDQSPGQQGFNPVARKHLRIAMVSARAFPFMGGIESHIHEVSSRLAAMGHELTVITTDPTGQLPRQQTEAGVRIIRVRAWPAKSDYYLAPAIYDEILRGKYDLVHVQGYHTLVAPLAMLASVRSRTPFVVTFHSGGHSSAFRKYLRHAQWKALAPLVRQASMHVGVSEFEADFFSDKMRLPRNRFAVVPNGAQLPDTSKAQDAAKEGRLIISIGRLERYKGHHRAIEAMHKLQWRYPDAKLKIVGSGPYEDELRRLVKSLRLGKKVTIESIPPAKRQSMADLLMAADLVVLLSEYEAHPVAIMEALSLGRKVLTSETSGFRELAAKGLVQTVPLKSTPVEIAAAIVDSFEAPQQPLKLSLPSWDDCARQLEAIYQSAVRLPE